MSRIGSRMTLTACGAAAACVVAVAAPAATLGPAPVKTESGPVELTGPAADGPWVAWGRDNLATGREKYFVERASGPPVPVNPRGTNASGGGVDGNALVYAQRPQSTTGHANLYEFDLRTHRRSALPRRVNSRYDELNPTLSGRWLLFDRDISHDGGLTGLHKVLLYDRRSGDLRLLAKMSWNNGANGAFTDLSAGQVNGHYAVWERTFYSELNPGPTVTVVRYDLRSGNRTKISAPAPDPGGPAYGDPHSAAVSSNGTVYYVRQAQGGSAAGDELVRQPLKGPAEVVAVLADALHASDLYVDDRAGGAHRVYFAESRPNGTADVYRLIDRS